MECPVLILGAINRNTASRVVLTWPMIQAAGLLQTEQVADVTLQVRRIRTGQAVPSIQTVSWVTIGTWIHNTAEELLARIKPVVHRESLQGDLRIPLFYLEFPAKHEDDY